MGADVVRPIVMPLSNPTPRAEAIPADVIEWTGGRALIGTGSPFPPIEYGGATYEIAQVNNVYVFPGLGLGVIACGAAEVTDDMITAASLAVAEFTSQGGIPSLVPPIDQSPLVARAVALAVARQAMLEGVAPLLRNDALATRIDESRWLPAY